MPGARVDHTRAATAAEPGKASWVAGLVLMIKVAPVGTGAPAHVCALARACCSVAAHHTGVE